MPRYTLQFTTTDVYYVCLPGRKTKSGNRMNLTVESRYDLMSYSDIAVGWARFGAAIGETQQFRRCATA